MGSQMPAGGQGGLSPETLRAMQELGINPQASPSPTPQTMPQVGPAPSPVPMPQVEPQGISGFLQNLFSRFLGGTSAKELAAPQQQVLTPEELQRRRQMMGGGQ